MATKTIRAKKNPVSSEMVKEPAVAYAPTREKTRKEYLIEKFIDEDLTDDEFGEFLNIPDEEFTIEEIALTRRIDPEIYKQLLSLDPKQGRYVYLNEDTLEYEQSDQYYSMRELEQNETLIDLKYSNGLHVGSLGGFVE